MRGRINARKDVEGLSCGFENQVEKENGMERNKPHF